jgi:hypothetical protein
MKILPGSPVVVAAGAIAAVLFWASDQTPDYYGAQSDTGGASSEVVPVRPPLMSGPRAVAAARAVQQTLELPEDREEGEEWVRQHISIYEDSYLRCRALADFDSPEFNPAFVRSEQVLATNAAKDVSPVAAWVAYYACNDGIVGSPPPGIPDLAYLPR